MQASGGRQDTRTPAPQSRPEKQDYNIHEAIPAHHANPALQLRPGHETSPVRSDEFGTFSTDSKRVRRHA